MQYVFDIDVVFLYTTEMDKDLKNKTFAELEELVTELGQKKYQAKYIFNFIHAKGAADIAKISSLRKAFRERLANQGYYISQLKITEKQTDPDGTVKYLFELPDGNAVETVLLFISNRRTLCVSPQSGCAMGCDFCATAKMGFHRNLTAGEIADQVNVVQKDIGEIRNIVYMGMGEPLLNYDNVMRSVRILSEPQGQNIGVKHITLSTCGIAERIEKLADEDILPRLAISLNATTDSLRSKLMPVNKKYPLRSLFDAINIYYLKTKRRVTFEYVLIAGVNDSDSDAEHLIKRLKGVKCNVNLIEYNRHRGCPLTASSKETINRFSKILYEAGVETSVRFKMGQTIKAACGQLRASRQRRFKV